MKLQYFVFLVILLIGCTPEPNIDENNILGKGDGNIYINGGEIGNDNVFVWHKMDLLEFTDYYSQVDTVIVDKTHTHALKYLVSENETATVKWQVTGKLINTNESKVWDGDAQKWVVTNEAKIDASGIENLRIEANVNFTNKTARRVQTIPIKINKNVSDAFGYTFGTLRTELSDKIERDWSPKLALVVNNSALTNPIDLLEFENGKLKKIYCMRNYSNSLNDFKGFCAKLKIPNKLIYEASQGKVKILNPQEWLLGTLKVKVYSTSLKNAFGAEINKDDNEIAFLTIEKQ